MISKIFPKTVSAAVVLLGAVLWSGCATVFHGSDQTVTFTSTPEGAEVIVDGLSKGVTPVSTKLRKNKYDSITVKKAGYKTVTRPLEKKYDSIALLNIFWDLSTTDMISGAAYEYEPGTYNFTLSKEENEEEVTKKAPAKKVSE